MDSGVFSQLRVVSVDSSALRKLVEAPLGNKKRVMD